jgi:hypothetical protein
VLAVLVFGTNPFTREIDRWHLFLPCSQFMKRLLVTGILTSPRDVAAMAAALIRLLAGG